MFGVRFILLYLCTRLYQREDLSFAGISPAYSYYCSISCLIKIGNLWQNQKVYYCNRCPVSWTIT